MRESQNLGLVVAVTHQEPTTTTSDIVSSSLCIKNSSVKVKSLVFAFLKMLL